MEDCTKITYARTFDPRHRRGHTGLDVQFSTEWKEEPEIIPGGKREPANPKASGFANYTRKYVKKNIKAGGKYPQEDVAGAVAGVTSHKGVAEKIDPHPRVQDLRRDLRRMVLDLRRMVQDLKRKVDGTIDIEDTLTPFSLRLEASPKHKHLKHYNFDSFDDIRNPEEHINYFEQITSIYNYTDLTKFRFFASTLKAGAPKWFS